MSQFTPMDTIEAFFESDLVQSDLITDVYPVIMSLYIASDITQCTGVNTTIPKVLFVPNSNRAYVKNNRHTYICAVDWTNKVLVYNHNIAFTFEGVSKFRFNGKCY